jgi:hypothetical protein
MSVRKALIPVMIVIQTYIISNYSEYLYKDKRQCFIHVSVLKRQSNFNRFRQNKKYNHTRVFISSNAHRDCLKTYSYETSLCKT